MAQLGAALTVLRAFVVSIVWREVVEILPPS